MIAGRYSLVREIGRGGMGVVWLGRDEVLGRQVALKRIGLLPGADGTDLERAEREARLGARLNHPNVVAVFDVIAESDARWLVMEYVEGVTLGQLVQQRGKLSADDAAPLLSQAAAALAAAHGADIVHRDVKPSNILLDHNGQVKLTDFGIARFASDPALTQTGLMLGSPAYLAPEIATGGRGSEAADVWSLGATTYYVLAGRAPYEVGENVLQALYGIVHEEPPRLIDAGWMGPLLEATMVKDPSRRWTMEQVRDFLAEPRQGVTLQPAAGSGVLAPAEEATRTRVLGSPDSELVPTVQAPPPVGVPSFRHPPTKVLLAGLGLLLTLLLAAGLYANLSTGGAAPKPAATKTAGSNPGTAVAQPTAKTMESFIRNYVATVSSNPDSAWQMLTPKFQRESGGIETYRRFWSSATNGRVLSISADPSTLTVSYQVRFDNFKNGPGPTVLDLTFNQGRYLIDGEHTKGFEPAGQSRASVGAHGHHHGKGHK